MDQDHVRLQGVDGLVHAGEEDVELVYPVHLSPVVQECAKKHLGDIPNVHLIPPVASFRFISSG